MNAEQIEKLLELLDDLNGRLADLPNRLAAALSPPADANAQSPSVIPASGANANLSSSPVAPTVSPPVVPPTIAPVAAKASKSPTTRPSSPTKPDPSELYHSLSGLVSAMTGFLPGFARIMNVGMHAANVGSAAFNFAASHKQSRQAAAGQAKLRARREASNKWFAKEFGPKSPTAPAPASTSSPPVASPVSAPVLPDPPNLWPEKQSSPAASGPPVVGVPWTPPNPVATPVGVPWTPPNPQTKAPSPSATAIGPPAEFGVPRGGLPESNVNPEADDETQTAALLGAVEDLTEAVQTLSKDITASGGDSANVLGGSKGQEGGRKESRPPGGGIGKIAEKAASAAAEMPSGGFVPPMGEAGFVPAAIPPV